MKAIETAMYSSQNISSIQIAILIIILFLTSRTSTAVCQKNYDNWIFGDGAFVSFQDGTPDVKPPLKDRYYYFAYSDANGELLFYCYAESAGGKVAIADCEGNRITDVEVYFPRLYLYTKVCCITDMKDKNIFHVIISSKESDGGNGVLHHIILKTDNRNVSVAKCAEYEDFVADELSAINIGGSSKLIVFDNTNGKIKVYRVSGEISLVAETDNPFPANPQVRSNIWQSPDGSFVYYIHGNIFYKVEMDGLRISDTGIRNAHCIEFSQSGDHFFCGRYGVDKREYIISRYATNDLNRCDTIAVLKKKIGEFPSRNDMQIAPDGNIYVGFHKEEFLSVIENPDSSLPECKFRYQFLCLNGAFFANMFQHIPRFLPTFRYTCSCGSVDFHYSGFPTETLLWNFGDGSSSSQESPSHIYEIPGTYEATLHVFFQENQIKTIKRQITIKKTSAPRIIPE